MTIIAISATEFFKRITEDRFGDMLISTDFEVVIDQSNITWHHRIIRDVIFKEKVVIRDAEINSGICFSNCKFEKEIIFHNVKSANYSSTYNPNNESVCFENSEAESIKFENDCFLDRSLTIKDNCKIKKISIHNFKNRNAGIIIKESSVDSLDLSKVNSNLSLNFSIFNKMLRVENYFGDIALVSNTFNNIVTFWNIEGRFTSNKNIYNNKFSIDGSRIKILTIFSDLFAKKGELENRDLSGNNLETYIKEIYISETNFIEGFDFNGLGKELEKLTLHITPDLKGVLNFDNWVIDKTIISGVNKDLKLLLKRIDFRFLLINDFTNYSDLSFDRCKGFGEATLNLNNSDLGSTRLNEFDFTSFKELRFNNVAIERIRPSNVKWFDEYQLQIDIDKQSEEEKFKRKREVYRQLKQALKSHGNQIDSLIFQARELKCLRNEFNNSKKYSFGERLIMTVSQSNDYGLNWMKPTCIVIVVTMLVYLLVLPGISEQILFSPSLLSSDILFTWEVLDNNFQIFWNLFNPLRRFDLTFGATIQSNWIYVIDLLHRIFLSVMIFQIIKGFRKYVSN